MMLRKLHLGAGILGLILFLLQGHYMDSVHDHLVGMADGPRMLYRSSHIYFMMAAVINIVLGVYLTNERAGLISRLQWLISAIFLLAPFLLLAGFFIEPGLQNFHRPYSRPALYALFGTGTVVSVLGLYELFFSKSDRI